MEGKAKGKEDYMGVSGEEIYTGAFTDLSDKEMSPADLLGHKVMAINPTKEDLGKYAVSHADLFLYEEPLLLSRDRKILYGYSAEDLQELVIPDDVEIYDNICCHSEDEWNEYSVEIGAGFKQIVDTYECFGYHNTCFSVKSGNPYFSDVLGMLYDKDERTLICYPSGKTTDFGEFGADLERCYIQLPMSTVKIARNAFWMLLLPLILVIPDSVEIIEPGTFCEMFDKGLWMTKKDVKERNIILPERFKDIIDKTWAEDDYNRPTIEFY
ncbi:MAG: hypothetical protein NC489_27655 [Ruminococcus flavefaciens]|nr:hypothetical protein [Ruminococcus flavefaciens]